MRCSNCGTEYPDGSMFCPNCGTPAAQQQTPQQQAGTAYNPIGTAQYGGYAGASTQQAPSPTYGTPSQGYSAGGTHCPSCGAELKPGATFCEVCGARVSAPAWQASEPKKGGAGKVVGIVVAVVAVLLVVVMATGGSGNSSSSSPSSTPSTTTTQSQGEGDTGGDASYTFDGVSLDGEWDYYYTDGTLVATLTFDGPSFFLEGADGSTKYQGTWAQDGTLVFSDGGRDSTMELKDANTLVFGDYTFYRRK